MIYQLLKTSPLEKCLKDSFTPFPAYSDREKWQNLSQELKDYYIQNADELKNYKWPVMPASMYMEFVRNGNRSNFQSLFTKRRMSLFILMMAECIEGKGEYLDNIIDLVWMICEESTWVIPAHNNQNNRSSGAVVDIEKGVIIDLTAAETGSLMSWVYYFLGNVLAEASPIIKRRIEIEIEKRIIKPYLERDDFWWMGFDKDAHSRVNNWNPWINSNVIVAFLIFADRETKIKGIEKAVRSTDIFLGSYAEDGGCDEGPGYFGVAGASLLDFVEELSFATNNEIDIHHWEIIKNMACYIYRVYIGKSFFVNFADAHAQIHTPSGLLYRTGRKVGDNNLSGFAQYLEKKGYVRKPYIGDGRCYFRKLTDIFQIQEENFNFIAPKSFFFEGIQVMTARDKEGSDGMFVAAKGGHNNESHNHNDIGNFILYYDAEPIIIDIGVETYTKKTFSPERYSIWTMQSSYHNCPEINGYEQLPGKDKKASAVKYSQQGDETALEMDLKEAYPQEAKIINYNRRFTFKHGHSFEIADNYTLESCTTPLIINLMAYTKPVIEKGSISFGPITMSYDEAEFGADFEQTTITDETLLQDWGKSDIYRVRLSQKNPKAEGKHSFIFARKV